MADPQQLDQFMDITGCSAKLARELLAASGFNLELAINIHIENPVLDPTIPNDNPGPSTSSSSDAEPSCSSKQNYDDSDGVRAPIAPKFDQMVVPEEDNFRLTRKRAVATSVFVPLRDFNVEADIQEQMAETASASYEPINKLRRLEDLFRPPVDLRFCGSFQGARDAATARNRWLVVNVQDHTEFSCQVLNRDVWSKQNIKSVIRNNFVFWQVSVDSPEGARFKTFYSVYNCPYVCIIDPRTGENRLFWYEINESFDSTLESFLNHSPTPTAASQNLNSMVVADPTGPSIPPEHVAGSSINMSEEDQIALAIRNSLEDRTIKSDVVASDSEDTDVESNSHASNEMAIDETFEQYLGPQIDDKTKITLRLPDGGRELIEWPCSSRLKALKLYIEFKYSEIAKEPFKILTTFPKQDLTKMEEGMTLKQANLHPASIIHIHQEDE